MIDAALPELVFHAALLFCRLGVTAMLLPGLGELELPMPVRLGLALAIVLLALPLLHPLLPPTPAATPELLRLIGTEILVGLWFGLQARLVMLALAQAGQILALAIGLASVLQPDALLGGQSSPLARLLGLGGAAIVLGSGLYALPLRALLDTYVLLPPGQALPGGDAALTLVQATAGSLALALQLAGPMLLAGMLASLALGLLARLAPQLSAYFVLAPGQVVAGLFLLALLAPVLFATWRGAAETAFLTLPGR